jgi:hypothetical protein
MSGPTQTTNSNQSSKSKSKTNTKSSLSPYGPFADEVNAFPDKLNSAYDMSSAALPGAMQNIQGLSDSLYAGGGYGQGLENIDQMPGLLGQGTDYLNDAGGQYGSTFDKVSGYLDPIASGSMIGEDNPYLQSILTNITDQVNNQIGSQFAAAGRPLGSNAYGTRALAKGLGEGLANPLFQNYQFERNAQMNAINQLQNAGYGAAAGYAGLAPGFSMISQGYGSIPGLYNANQQLVNQAGLQGAGLSTLQQALPYQGIQNYENLIMQPAQAFGTQRSKSKSKGTNVTIGTQKTTTDDGGASAAGTIIAGLGLLSDRRAKDNIEQVGMLFDGTPVYRFTYKGDDIVQIGLMADEVEENTPEAVHTGRDGLKRVDYKLATDKSAEMWQ